MLQLQPPFLTCERVFSFKIPLYKVICSRLTVGAAQCVQGLAMTFKLADFTNETSGEISYSFCKKCYQAVKDLLLCLIYGS